MLSLKPKNSKFIFPLISNPLPRVLKFEKFLVYLGQISKGGTVLDYGSGDRPYEELLLTIFDKYVSADYAPTNKHHSREPDVYIRDNGLPDIPTASIDCVVLTEVLEHVYEPKKTLNEIHRILKPGGILIGTVPFIVSEHEQPFDFYRYTYFSLERMFEESFFEIIHLDYIGNRLATAITIMSSFFQLFTKIFRKLHLGIVADFLNVLIKIPEYIYLFVCKAGVNFNSINYLKILPVGYGFYLKKKRV